jgi:hypothetical protein
VAVAVGGVAVAVTAGPKLQGLGAATLRIGLGADVAGSVVVVLVVFTAVVSAAVVVVGARVVVEVVRVAAVREAAVVVLYSRRSPGSGESVAVVGAVEVTGVSSMVGLSASRVIRNDGGRDRGARTHGLVARMLEGVAPVVFIVAAATVIVVAGVVTAEKIDAGGVIGMVGVVVIGVPTVVSMLGGGTTLEVGRSRAGSARTRSGVVWVRGMVAIVGIVVIVTVVVMVEPPRVGVLAAPAVVAAALGAGTGAVASAVAVGGVAVLAA